MTLLFDRDFTDLSKLPPAVEPALPPLVLEEPAPDPEKWHAGARRPSLHLYFVQCGEDGPIKIGVSREPWRRLQLLQNGCPYVLRMLGAVIGGVNLEPLLHQQFADYHIRGEWFEPVPELLAKIAELKKLS